ncbi:menaquinone biosynthesis decarboxylase [Campylobacter sp. MG1]|uniref:menaquinone biosynthesis decarboxylase n=1 Tax=Campylobacter sp. MG1 TaxID=2976332 RepID=UPI00226CCF83|nr:menaquinone biosynthesis decarboxylase [Campylobacter sp. MG1]
MKNYIEKLKKANLLNIIETPLDTELEIPHLAYLEAKKEDSKVLLFTKPIKDGKVCKIPVIMNVFANKKALNLVLGKSTDEIANEISSLLNLHIPPTFGAKIDLAKKLFSLKNIAPKREINKNAPCKQKEYLLNELPILKTWEKDAGAFITMGQVYTKSLDGKQNNLGMYRLQVIDSKHLIMHFQLHKDANNFFHEYKKANKKMPIAIAIGDDPLHIFCAQAPLPKGIFELMLYGFIKKQGAKLVKCDTNDLYVPSNSDFVIEGEIDVNHFAIEGPFGDHTGFYTPQGNFPVMKITKITGKNEPIYNATVVGKPPLEDKWMGYGTERIFLPLLKTTCPDLIDYCMPENGVFHNLIIAKIKNNYLGSAMANMHAFWGVGQMSFVKNAIFVDEYAPNLRDYPAICEYILNNFSPNRLLKSYGICDELDHSSTRLGMGGKLGLDATNNAHYHANTYKDENLEKEKIEYKPDLKNLLDTLKPLGLCEYSIYYAESKTQITCISLKRDNNLKEIYEICKNYLGGIVVLFDEGVNLNNPYMLIWKAFNNYDPANDIIIDENGVLVAAYSKNILDNYINKWPETTECNKEVIKKLIDLKLINDDETFFNQYEIF